MDHWFTIYSLIFLGTALVSFFVSFLAYQRKKVKGAVEITRLTIFSGIWAFMAMFESSATHQTDKVFWSQMAYFGAVTTPVFYLLFVLRFVGIDKWLTFRKSLLLFIIPVVTFIIVLTNSLHQLIWTGFSEISPVTNLMEYYHGPWFWIGFFGYNYLLLVAATYFLFMFLGRQPHAYRLQGWIIIIAGLCPWTTSVIYLSGLNPVPGLDIVPLSMVVSSILFVYAILYMGFLDLAPIARETLVETLSDGILAIDSHNRIQDINTAAISFLGISKKNVAGQVFGSSLVTEKPLLDVVLLGEHYQTEVTIDNGHKTFRILRKVIADVPGSRLIVIRDITEQRQNQDIILRRDKLLDAIARATALLIQGEDLDESINGALAMLGKATGVNRVYIFKNEMVSGFKWPLMSQVYEWTDGTVPVEINNPELQQIPYETACPRWYENLSAGKVIAGNIREFPQVEREALEPQGIVSVMVTPVFIDKSFWGFIGFDDCRKEREWPVTEERILATAANTIGAAYLRKKHQDELLEAKIKAEESDKLKSAFLANMSHEIRTPMNGILGFIGLLQEQDLTSDERAEYIDIVRSSGERLIRTLHDIVDLSKIESGLMPVSPSMVHVQDLIHGVFDFFRRDATQKGIQLFIHQELPAFSVEVFSDREKLNSILSNLIKNAIKFTDRGFVEFGFVIKEGVLEFFVKDTGIGIPLNRQEAVFERFIQADISDSRQYEGTGLGLSIARAYVLMLGGNIRVESEPGKGSVFRFTIPWVKNAVTTMPRIVSQQVGTDNKAKKATILVTEDDPVNMEFIEIMLTRAGFSVVKAESGAEAIAHLRNNTMINMVIMDIRLPGMDGYETTKEIRNWNKTIPVVALTAHAFKGDREKAMKAGCSHYLTKPVRKIELLRVIESLV
jgi:signal transduction histidine kinase/CheY-like chemotaxis protein/PAS domain-containing protein